MQAKNAKFMRKIGYYAMYYAYYAMHSTSKF